MPRAPRWLTTLLRSRELSILARAAARHRRRHDQDARASCSARNSWRDLLLTPSILLLLAVGQAVVIITRNVDLSVGSVLGADGVPHRPAVHRPPGPADRARSSLTGVARGRRARPGQRPAGRASAGCRRWSSRSARSTSTAASCSPGPAATGSTPPTCPTRFLALGTKQVLAIPVLFISPWSSSVVVGYYLHTARGGRELYAIGSDPDAAVLYGLRVRRRLIARVRAQRGARRAGRRRLRRPLRHGQLGRRHRHRAAGGRRRRHRRRRDLRRQRHRLGRRPRRRPPGHHQPRAADPGHPGLLAAGASSAR